MNELETEMQRTVLLLQRILKWLMYTFNLGFREAYEFWFVKDPITGRTGYMTTKAPYPGAVALPVKEIERVGGSTTPGYHPEYQSAGYEYAHESGKLKSPGGSAITNPVTVTPYEEVPKERIEMYTDPRRASTYKETENDNDYRQAQSDAIIDARKKADETSKESAPKPESVTSAATSTPATDLSPQEQYDARRGSGGRLR